MRKAGAVLAVSFLVWLRTAAIQAQQPGDSSVIRGIDAANSARFESVLGFAVTEHYAVYRGRDETHPVAEMTVQTVYRKEAGKSYTVLSQTGPEIVRKFAFGALLDTETRINEPGKVQDSWFTSANYAMKLKPGGPEPLDGRECFVLAVTPKRKAPNLITGTLWVDAKDDSIVQIQGIASKNPSFWSGPTQMMRQYARINGFAMATHARAVSNSFLFGRTTVTIDYRDYQIRLLPAK